MIELKQTSQFKKDLKRYKYDEDKLKELKTVLTYLQKNGTVPQKYNPHPLWGEYKGCLECHIQGDFLLIWIDKDHSVIKLIRLGSHSELFK